MGNTIETAEKEMVTLPIRVTKAEQEAILRAKMDSDLPLQPNGEWYKKCLMRGIEKKFIE